MNNKSSLKFDRGALGRSVLRIFGRFKREWIIRLFSAACVMKEVMEAEFKIEDQQKAATVKYLLLLETDKPSLNVIL